MAQPSVPNRVTPQPGAAEGAASSAAGQSAMAAPARTARVQDLVPSGWAGLIACLNRWASLGGPRNWVNQLLVQSKRERHPPLVLRVFEQYS